MENNFAFLAKKRKKKWVFWVFRSALKRFGIVLYDSDDAQTYRMAFQLDARGNPTLKTATLFGKCVLSRKTSKNPVFWGLQVCTKTLRIFIL